MLLSLLRGLVLFGASRSLADLYLGDFYLDLADILADPDDSLLYRTLRSLSSMKLSITSESLVPC